MIKHKTRQFLRSIWSWRGVAGSSLHTISWLCFMASLFLPAFQADNEASELGIKCFTYTIVYLMDIGKPLEELPLHTCLYGITNILLLACPFLHSPSLQKRWFLGLSGVTLLIGYWHTWWFAGQLEYTSLVGFYLWSFSHALASAGCFLRYSAVPKKIVATQTTRVLVEKTQAELDAEREVAELIAIVHLSGGHGTEVEPQHQTKIVSNLAYPQERWKHEQQHCKH